MSLTSEQNSSKQVYQLANVIFASGGKDQSFVVKKLKAGEYVLLHRGWFAPLRSVLPSSLYSIYSSITGSLLTILLIFAGIIVLGTILSAAGEAAQFLGILMFPLTLAFFGFLIYLGGSVLSRLSVLIFGSPIWCEVDREKKTLTVFYAWILLAGNWKFQYSLDDVKSISVTFYENSDSAKVTFQRSGSTDPLFELSLSLETSESDEFGVELMHGFARAAGMTHYTESESPQKNIKYKRESDYVEPKGVSWDPIPETSVETIGTGDPFRQVSDDSS